LLGLGDGGAIGPRGRCGQDDTGVLAAESEGVERQVLQARRSRAVAHVVEVAARVEPCISQVQGGVESLRLQAQHARHGRKPGGGAQAVSDHRLQSRHAEGVRMRSKDCADDLSLVHVVVGRPCTVGEHGA
jgi:hypothetical protein